ncbi:hydantoinase/oxoprolinase family protein [Pseudonocardia sp. H11422]|uniref:hydantoinase/oxoprolinase family protein n=1 Tax=Pseudonocardia sp. H11422 TaxID=2835866 RepID=UPI0020288A3D|nr:hydantoinase/oxoprolinase family protein [Pseudonocardia sp. H11422]
MAVKVGVDIGGTFTDLVLMDEDTDETHIFKLLTDHGRPATAVVEGLRALLDAAKALPADVAHVRHGTTLVTNAVLERRGARTGLITTQGFRDVLQIATEDRYDLYDLHIERPDPIVGRRDVHEIGERMRADGTVLQPLDAGEMEALAGRLRRAGYESVAIALLHSYRNSAHEDELYAFLTERLPDVEISRSSRVSPEIREYVRASTTTVNAYVVPLVKRYLRELEEGLQEAGTAARLLLMLSSGGICTAQTAAAYPVRLIESGPAAGALAAADIAGRAGRQNVLSFDMGGTTAKACLIVGGEPQYTPGLEVARQYRFKAGSGLPLQVRSVDLIEIGAGGGSIATVNELGLVQIGPESSGSEPGPACYGRGGTHPTVTDADLVLGYLNPEFFLGGAMRLDVEAARTAIQTHIAEPLGLTVLQAAEAIRRVVDENMAGAARMYALEHGYEPATFPLIGFGGAGPVHACGVARILGTTQIIVPPDAGVNSAYGLLAAPLAFDFVRSGLGRLAESDWSQVNADLNQMEAEGRALLERSGVAPEDQTVVRLCDLRFAGQGNELSVPAPSGELAEGSAGALTAAFTALYRQLYTHVPGEVALEVVSWRVLVSGRRAPVAGAVAVEPDPTRSRGTRPVYWGASHGWVETEVINRYGLRPGDRLEGPLIVEERESTTVLDPETTLTVDENRNLVADLRPRSGNGPA